MIAEGGKDMIWGILLGLIIAVAAIKRCTGYAARSRSVERTADAANTPEDQTTATQADPEIINHILFLESVAIRLAKNPNPFLQNHTPNPWIYPSFCMGEWGGVLRFHI